MPRQFHPSHMRAQDELTRLLPINPLPHCVIRHAGPLLASFLAIVAAGPCMSQTADSSHPNFRAEICQPSERDTEHNQSLSTSIPHLSVSTPGDLSNTSLSRARNPEGIADLLTSEPAEARAQNVPGGSERLLPSAAGSTAPSRPTVSAQQHVTYDRGLLTIEPQNASLRQILDEIQQATGIEMDAPWGLSERRMYDRLGPTPLRDALVAVLYGTGLNYIIQSAAGSPQSVQKVIVSVPAPSTAIAQHASSLPQQSPEAQAYGAVAGTEDSPSEFVPPASPMQSRANPNTVPGIPQGFNLQQAAAEAHKTPGQILDELQKHQLEILNAQAPQQ